ncbi:uncharacterized protein LOC141640609 [Silene latifolia]|uniref:uncharacterized protein LOC141640609 n=1 Tax=Silene latifolia TaxID=37657 RepID=UPI003D7730A0
MYNKKSASPRCLFKIDLQKAYDSLEWDFVEQLLLGLNFPDLFTQQIMTCIKTTSFTLALSGNHFGYFKGKRDDLLMFCKGTAQSIMLLIRAFCTFSKASGLSMNNRKSEVYFNGMANDLKDDIRQPGRISKRECNVLTEKILNRIRSLGARKLSYASRLTLINSVLNTLYAYWANIFILPKYVIRRIEAVCRNFFWDGCAEYHRVSLVNWDTITLPKNEGRLGGEEC